MSHDSFETICTIYILEASCFNEGMPLFFFLCWVDKSHCAMVGLTCKWVWTHPLENISMKDLQDKCRWEILEKKTKSTDSCANGKSPTWISQQEILRKNKIAKQLPRWVWNHMGSCLQIDRHKLLTDAWPEEKCVQLRCDIFQNSENIKPGSKLCVSCFVLCWVDKSCCPVLGLKSPAGNHLCEIPARKMKMGNPWRKTKSTAVPMGNPKKRQDSQTIAKVGLKSPTGMLHETCTSVKIPAWIHNASLIIATQRLEWVNSVSRNFFLSSVVAWPSWPFDFTGQYFLQGRWYMWII